MEKATVLFVFNENQMCFVHVLLTALDMESRGFEVKIVIEGAATKLIPELARESNPLHGLYVKVKGKGLIDGVCRACSNKMGTIGNAELEGLLLLDDMSGHPSMAAYIEKGYNIVTF